MNESIHKYFRVGTLLWMSYPKLDPLEALGTGVRKVLRPMAPTNASHPCR